MAGAIENARLYEETRRRVGELEHLTQLGETIARAETLDELLPRRRRPKPRAARRVRVPRLPARPRQRGAAAPRVGTARTRRPGRGSALAGLGPELARSGRHAAVAVPLVAGDELLGLLTAEGTAEIDLARNVASQTAVAIKKIELIERLTEKNLIKDFFEQLASGAALGDLEGRALRLRLRPRPALSRAGRRAGTSDGLERVLAALAPGSLFDRRDDSMRALLRVPQAGEEALLDEIRRLQVDVEPPVAAGVSNVCRGAASFKAGFEEAGHALLGTTVLQPQPGVMAYDELGPYKYLLRMSIDADVRDPQRDAIASLADYDRQRSTSLLPTLEEFLRRRGQHQRDRRGALRPSEHAPPAPAPDHGHLRHRPAQGRLADGRDRGQAGEARGTPSVRPDHRPAT